VWILHPVIKPAPGFLPISVAEHLHRRAVGTEVVGNEDMRGSMAFHEFPQEFNGCLAITAATNLTLLISELIKRWAPATQTSYNTLAFDEEFLRQSFYQNLHPNLYQTQFDNNDRLDLMKVIYAVRDREPDALTWPLDDLGRESFKLDRLTPANGFANHDAHDALGDVEATIHIASLIRKRAPAVWDQCLKNRDKNEVDGLLRGGRIVRLIERFGAAPPRSYFAVYAGTNPQNKNSVAFLDLDLCDASIIDANDREIAKAVSASPKQIRTVATNKVPNVFPVASPSAAHNKLAHLVAARPDFQERVGQALGIAMQTERRPNMSSSESMAGSTAPPTNRSLKISRPPTGVIAPDLSNNSTTSALNNLVSGSSS
jgi:hypothetical protein